MEILSFNYQRWLPCQALEESDFETSQDACVEWPVVIIPDFILKEMTSAAQRKENAHLHNVTQTARRDDLGYWYHLSSGIDLVVCQAGWQNKTKLCVLFAEKVQSCKKGTKHKEGAQSFWRLKRNWRKIPDAFLHKTELTLAASSKLESLALCDYLIIEWYVAGHMEAGGQD